MLKTTMIVLATMQLTLAAAANADDYKIDPVHSGVCFQVMHLKVSNVPGRFDTFSGNYTLDANEAKCQFDFTVETGSVNTSNGKRDEHLKSPDFFNAKQFPTMTFKSTKVTRQGTGWEVTGDFTLLGQTHPITVQVAKIGEADTGKTGYRSGIEVTGAIKRREFGMNYGIESGALGDEVKIHVLAEGQRK